jgi:two-component system chemotaxis response regulator CheB
MIPLTGNSNGSGNPNGSGITGRVRVLVADDSPFVCHLLSHYLTAGGCEVVGTALDGGRALELARRLSPDVMTLDLDMPGLHIPGLGGLAVLERLMKEHPLPVVVISGVSGRSASRTLSALDLGAVDFVLKYEPRQELDPARLRREIVAKVLAASRIRVIRSLPSRPRVPLPIGPAPAPYAAPAPASGDRAAARGATVVPLRPPVEASPAPGPERVVVIGASTGGPLALRQLLQELPGDFGAAVVVVQHIPATFTPVLAAQLDRQVALAVREAEEGDRLTAGTVLVAPGGSHLLLRPDGRVTLKPGPEIRGHCPSIDVAMQSVAQHFGARASGVLLTGMGQDGAQGLVAIHAKGGLTLAQDAASCAVHGMPQRAVEQGAVDRVAPPAELGRLLAAELASRRRRHAC